MMLMQALRLPLSELRTATKNDRIYGSTLEDSYPPAAGAAEVSKSIAIVHREFEHCRAGKPRCRRR